jgi:hypothetical protein
MYGCQNWQCSAGDPPESTAKKYNKTTYKKIENDGVQVENPGTTTLRKILLYIHMWSMSMQNDLDHMPPKYSY